MDGHGHGFFKLRDAVLSQPHAAVTRQSHCLACVQSRLAVFPVVDLSPSRLKAKSKGYTIPVSARFQSSAIPVGSVGIESATVSKLKARRQEKSLQRHHLHSISMPDGGEKCDPK